MEAERLSGSASGRLVVGGPPVAGFAPLLLQQANRFHAHSPVHCLAHVVNREQGDRNGGEGLHLHSGASPGLGRDNAFHRRGDPVHVKINPDPGQRDWVAQGDQLGSALGRLDRRDARHPQDVAFLGFPFQNELQSLRPHVNRAGGAGDAVGLGLFRHVHHVGLAAGIEVSEPLCHGTCQPELKLRKNYHSTVITSNPSPTPASGRAGKASVRLGRAVSFLLLALAATRALGDGLPDLGDASQAVLSPQQERRIGERAMRDIRQDRNYDDDPELTQYLNDLGYRLVAASPDPGQRFEFFALKDPTINAFALPGGFIGVHTGLILAAQNESELASVLAHEIAHVTQHHLARMIASQKQATLPSLAALALAILAARSNPQVSQAAIATAQAGAIQSQLNFSRENEREADRVGLTILEKAGFDPRAMPAFFERLQRATRLYANNAPAYLRTHPLTYERIADLENRVQSLPHRQVPDSADFQLLRAKLQARQGLPEDAVAEFKARLKEGGSEMALRYGLAVALLRAQRFDPAEKELAVLESRFPPNALVETLAAEAKLAQGQIQAALDQYRRALKAYPRYLALIYGYADALLQSRQAGTALQFVSNELQTFPDDYHLYQLQAKSYAALGKRLLQHRAQAEAYVRQDNIPAAIDQLRIALRSGDGDFYEKSSAEARLKELQQSDATHP